MRFQTPLVPGRLVRRYKRFLADVILEDGREVVAHCPNPGGMLGLKEPGAKIWLEPNYDPRKKLKYGWRLNALGDGHWCGIDTSVPNKIVKEALQAGAVARFADYTGVRAEVPYGQNSRVDFLLTADGRPDVYLEVKNVHFRREDDWAEFPDSVTARGTKHLHDLTAMVAEGHRAVMLYVVQRTDCARFKLAGDIDPVYARAFDMAREAGVEMMACTTQISPDEIILDAEIPVDGAPQA